MDKLNSQWTKLITKTYFIVPAEKNCLKLIILGIFLAAGFRLLVLLDIVEKSTLSSAELRLHVLTEKDAHLSSVNCFVVRSEWVEAFVTVV